MLEGLVAWVLNNYLGKYVENLNTDQLNIALLSGQVELENLPLKKDAFNNLGIPIRVQSGFLGKIKLQIPLRQIQSAPWVIAIEQLYIVATPINLCEWDGNFEENILQEYKHSLLDTLEAQWRAETESNPESGYYASSITSWMSYGTSLIANIIENLQLKIKDVHLRYEDNITCGEKNSFACGLTMESFSAESCDSEWQRGFTIFSLNQSACSFKMLELQNMAFYWDEMTSPADMFANLPLAEFAVQMSGKSRSFNHKYIISPVSAVAQFKRERCEQPLRSRSRPRLTCKLSLDEVPILITDKQYNQVVGCSRGLSMIGRIRVFRNNRPNSLISNNPRSWWIYATKCYFPSFVFMDSKPTWETCLSSARRCIQYVDLYATLLITPSTTLTSELKTFKDDVEWSTPFEQLKLLREAAMRRVPNKQTNTEKNSTNINQDRAQSRSILMTWFPQWWVSTNSTTNPDVTPEFEGEILDVIADSIENNTALKRDAVFGLFEFNLSKGSLKLCTSSSTGKEPDIDKTMLELHFENVGFSYASRPRTSSHTIITSLGAIYLRDHFTENTLFPTLIAPQGVIRESLCNLRFSSIPSHMIKPISSTNCISSQSQEAFFQLTYECQPNGQNYDYRLFVKSQSLEIVYNPQAVKWLVDFLTYPLSINTESNEANNDLPLYNTAYTRVKNTTKMHLINQWENILQGDMTERSLWNLELDISAPQIFLIEKFTDKNGVVAVLDFGRMLLSNGVVALDNEQEVTEEDDNEMFMTPCSTPPGSQASDINLTDCGASPIPPDTPQPNLNTFLNQDAIHHRLYDRYKVEFSDLQILIGKIKDNWKLSNVKGTSSLHILDRFNISLQIERRLIYTSDPHFPSITLCGSLPNLIVHLNEHKVLFIQSLLLELNTNPSNVAKTSVSPLPFGEEWKILPPQEGLMEEQSEMDVTEKSSNQLSRLLMLQFSIDQMSLEVQSRGRSIAEVQVCGVRASFTKRMYDLNLSLSVHSFLLVDALQTYGPDFELLVASHKHVGMDSVSGSIRGSEPTSPTSPSSPPDCAVRYTQPPAPAALSQALNSLNTQNSSILNSIRQCKSPIMETPDFVAASGIIDSEALIVVEITVVSRDCPSNQGEELIIANILFNTLDIIANQETIVELIGFAKRVSASPFTTNKPSENLVEDPVKSIDVSDSCDEVKSELIIRNEITFDFHRLNVLLLRASIEDGNLVGKKIATATMSDAKIQATIGQNTFELTGSLGGLQVVSLCPDSTLHNRVLSVGHDPLVNQNVTISNNLVSSLTQEVYLGLDNGMNIEENKAFSFNIVKSYNSKKKIVSDISTCDDMIIDVKIKMASVWYTHSGIFIGEIQSCATEFKQYLSNLAKSIKAAATDMAIGLVNPRGDLLYNNIRPSGSTDWISPRRPRSISIGFPDTEADSEQNSLNFILKLDVILETPVVVLPRSASSTEVFIARLGNISITNKSGYAQHYFIQIKNINMYSLDIGSRGNTSLEGLSVDEIYKCGSYGKPVLHDTTVHLNIEQIENVIETEYDIYTQINGKVVKPLKVSATRLQYEQLLDTVNTLGVTLPSQKSMQPNIYSDHSGISALNMDYQYRAALLNTYNTDTDESKTNDLHKIKVDFQLPIFTVELRGDFGKGEQSLVNLSFRDFFVKYEKCHIHETNIELSLRSISMEDLLRDVDSRHRFMMLSHKMTTPKSDFLSHSTPDLRDFDNFSVDGDNTSYVLRRNSLPTKFSTKKVPEKSTISNKHKTYSNYTFPQDNLVLISIQFIDPDHPLFVEKYKKVFKSTKVNFNSLDLVISIDSWVVVLDFFGMGTDTDISSKKSDIVTTDNKNEIKTADKGDKEMEVAIQSLNVILLKPQYEVCRANISRLKVLLEDASCKDGNNGGRRISGTLGSMSLLDLSPHGYIWHERFLTSGKEALNFQYERYTREEALLADCDTRLLIEMSSIVYVHTKRFIAEIQAFFREFSLLQSVISQARQKVSVTANSQFTKMQMSIECLCPAILIPVCNTSTSLLVAELGKISVNNEFRRAGAPNTISTIRDPDNPIRELLDVMSIHLENMNLYCGEKYGFIEDSQTKSHFSSRASHRKRKSINPYEFGPGTLVCRQGPFLLTDKCGLLIQVEKNLEKHHNVADMSIQATLDTLDGSIDLQQYKVIKGLLSNNIGENIEDLNPTSNTQSVSTYDDEKIWTLTSVQFDLLNVTLYLETEHDNSSLACINFIKSRLLVEIFSDMTQDIDLVSQEILLSDTRYRNHPVNKRCNVFSNIVSPMRSDRNEKKPHSVQAEIHARKRREHSAYTIMVNSMRLMAIIDWWQAVNEFIMSPGVGNENNLIIKKRHISHDEASNSRHSPDNDGQFELKINITDSQIVFVEDTSLWDTNAVILKSTIVISHKPDSKPKPLSCVLNHCEVFSCVLGMEEETALSIIDPVTIQIDLTSNKVLQIQTHQLSIRLSYHDVCMLIKMFHSLPQQTRSARAANKVRAQPVNKNKEHIQKLCNLGFATKDCEIALTMCNGNLEQAAFWLTENSKTSVIQLQNYENHKPQADSQAFTSFQVKAECISICIIDDCRDSDVPLLELSLSEMVLLQDLQYDHTFDIETPLSPPLCITPMDNSTSFDANYKRDVGPGGGKLQCKLASDYYNRALSGWEPFIEPWRCDTSWDYSSANERNRLQLELNSTEMLNLNITTSLIELYNLVKLNWTQDYYSLSSRSEMSPKLSPPGYRRRSPFVPFALRNLSGCKLWFTTIVTTADVVSENIELSDPDESWIEVLPDETIPFKFCERGKQRHRDSHKLRLHQLGVRIDGWNSITPVCVDKVGVFFRQIIHVTTDLEARAIFAVTLEGSARKLVTIRSALQLVNHLPETIEVRADNVTSKIPNSVWSASGPKSIYVKSGETWCVPLSHNQTPMWIRPINNLPNSSSYSTPYLYCAQPLDWRLAARQPPETRLQIAHVCHSSSQTSYRFSCILQRENFPLGRGLPQPGHIIILKPPIQIINLLPIELNFKLGQFDQGIDRISPGQIASLSQVDTQKPMEIAISLEGFPGFALLSIQSGSIDSFSTRLKLSDTSSRKLTLNAFVSIKTHDSIKVSISAPYWIINRTGVPIVFKQEGVPTETAGQFEEHEIARMVAPLLFSFADSDGSPTVVARVGTGVIANGASQWCSPFGLSPGLMVRRLIVTNSNSIGGNEKVLLVGIAIRPGRGRYRHTNICTISPRFQIHNNTSYHLQFSQKCYATSIVDPGTSATYLRTTPKCSIPFHWPRHDSDLLLCVKIIDIPNCNWSGGFKIDTNHSFHINIRDNNAVCYFIRLEVILQSATYFVVFTDAETMPPPIRIDNFSLVHLTFHQVGCKEESLIKAQSSRPWALVEPCEKPILAIRAPGGTATTINLQKLNEPKSLTYQNFIYIAFTGTHQLKDHGTTSSDVENSQLVLEVGNGSSSSGSVFLSRKRFGERAQLWRLNEEGHLLHEGSSPPQPANAPPDVNAPHALVLDIEGPAPQPSKMVGLCVRRINPRRTSTQSWRFTSDGRLRCVHNNMNVQPLDGFFGLREGNRAVLGLTGPTGTHMLPNGTPIEHAVTFQTLRPGSGSLKVVVMTDGPTRVIKITDISHDVKPLESNFEESGNPEVQKRDMQIRVAVGGVGLSLVSQVPSSQELLFCLFSGVLFETILTNNGQALNLTVQNIQIDNQLLETLCPVLLHTTKIRSGGANSASGNMPAIQLSVDKVNTAPSTRYNAHIFKHFIISLRPLSIHLEERLLLKLCVWFGIGGLEDSLNKEEPDETDFETQKILTEITAVHAKRYYFGVLRLEPNQIRLSMQTVGKLPFSLAIIKKRLGLRLIKFEDAGVELESFVRWHPFETSQFLWHSIIKHYKDELKWQAAIILGSVDFLGNPLGFVQDVSDGVSGLIYEGNVGALVKNVAHGLSNSAAKVTESLGDGIGRVILDEDHEEIRARIRGIGEGSGTNHLVAGLRGLGLGLLGGFTSLVKHTYEGAAHEGLPGFFTGVGRGLIGTVTKPVVGVLDLAAETAAAVRETSRRSDRWLPERSRPPRCPIGPGGLLPRYSRVQSIGRQYLYVINGRNYDEGFLAYDCVCNKSNMQALISTLYFRIFTCPQKESYREINVIIDVDLSNLINCHAVTNTIGECYIELTVKVDGTGGVGIKRPQVQCDSPELARWVSHQVNYAKCMFSEQLFTLQEADI